MPSRSRCTAAVVAVVALALPAVRGAAGPNATISSFAGNGQQGRAGNGGAATAAQFYYPYVAAPVTTAGGPLPVGSVVVVDMHNNQLRAVSAAGTVTAFAGTGAEGFSGDGGQASAAMLSVPEGVCFGPTGTVYIVDTGNSRIRTVVASGVIRTIAGTLFPGFAGDGGSATSAELNRPAGCGIDATGRLFISDTLNNRIRAVTVGGVISTFAGNGRAGFAGDGTAATYAEINAPRAIALDAAGALYIADSSNNRVRRVASAIITTFAGTGTAGFAGDGGAATSAALRGPTGVAATNGTLFIVDNGNQRVRTVTAGGIISTFAGTGVAGYSGDGGPARFAQLNDPVGIAIDGAGTVFIGDADNNRVRVVRVANASSNATASNSPSRSPAPPPPPSPTPTATPVAVFVVRTFAGTGQQGAGGDGGDATAAQLFYPFAAVPVNVSGGFVNIGSVLIVDTYNHEIRAVSELGHISRMAGTGTPGFSGDAGKSFLATLNRPQGLCIAPAGTEFVGTIYIVDTRNSRIRSVVTSGVIRTVAGSATAGFSGDGGSATAAQLNLPTACVVDSSARLYISDAANNRVRRVTLAGGVITTFAGTGVAGYSGEGGPATAAQFNSPFGLAFAPWDGTLYIADSGNHRVRRVTAAGAVWNVAGNGAAAFAGDGGFAQLASLNSPSGVAVAAGNASALLIADTVNCRLRAVSFATLRISTFAGTGAAGNGGDGGPPAAAQLNNPVGVAFDPWGTVFVGDALNDRVRVIVPAAPTPSSSPGPAPPVSYDISTVAGNGTRGAWGRGGVPATATALNEPNAVVDLSYRDFLGRQWQFLVVDSGSHAVLAVDFAGTLFTIAGTGEDSFAGDGGNATAAALSRPLGACLVTPSDDVYGLTSIVIVDSGNSRVRTVSASGVINTIAGSLFPGFSGDGGQATAAQLNVPAACAFDPTTGRIFVADTGNQRIRAIAASGFISTFAGTGVSGYSGDGGPATAARLFGPAAIAVDYVGRLVIADTRNNRVRRVAGGTISSIAGNGFPVAGGDGGPAIAAAVGGPSGVATFNDTVWIADRGNDRVRYIDEAGTIWTVAGTGVPGFSGDGGPATAARLANVSGVAVVGAGDSALVADSSNQRVRRLGIHVAAAVPRAAPTASARPQTSVQAKPPPSRAAGPTALPAMQQPPAAAPGAAA